MQGQPRRAGWARPAGQHPDHRRDAVHRRGNHLRAGRTHDRRGCRSVLGVAEHTGARARRAGGPAGRAAHRTQERPGHAGDDRGRQDHLRGAGRSAGDDRRLRFRGRSVPPALRTHHRFRARRAPAGRDLASARCGGRDHRVQFSGCGVGMERRDSAGVRGHRGVEALGADPVDGPGLPGADRPGRRRRRGAARGERPAPGRPRPGRTAGRRPPDRAVVRDRLGADGSAGRSARRRAASGGRCWNWAATTRPS